MKEYKSKYFSEKDEQNICKMYGEKVPVHEIAKRYHHNHWCIYKILRKYNLKILGRKTPNHVRFSKDKCNELSSVISKRAKELVHQGKINIAGWNKNLTKETSEGVKKISLSKIAKPRSKVCKEKISLANKNKHNSPATEFKKGNKIPAEVLNKLSLKWQDEAYRERMLSLLGKAWSKKPNKPEKIIINFVKQNNINLIYTGNWDKVISGFNPDFINEDKKIIVEFNGKYWHSKPQVVERDKRKLSAYLSKGYKTIILNEDDLSEAVLKNKLMELKNET